MFRLPKRGNYPLMYESGELMDIHAYLKQQLKQCDLCPRLCGINRNEITGVCGQNQDARLTNALLHTGEEPPLIANKGAGTVFFSGCSLNCCYCQNFAFSQLNNGTQHTSQELSEVFLRLQKSGASNLDLVTPAAHLTSIIEALIYAVPKGLNIPIVYNTSGYERVEVLKKIEGCVDVYLTDIRYTDDLIGMKYSGVSDYWTVTKRAIREMYRQKGSKGIIIRHLVLPNGLGGTKKAMEFVAEELSTSVSISLMSQYFPVYRAKEFEQINRKIDENEYAQAVQVLEQYGLHNGWTQQLSEL